MFQNWLADFVICFIEIKKKNSKAFIIYPDNTHLRLSLISQDWKNWGRGKGMPFWMCPIYLTSWYRYLSNEGGTLLSCHSVPPCGPPSPAPPDRGTSPCTPWDPDNGHTENLNIDVTLLIWSEVNLLWIFSTGNKKWLATIQAQNQMQVWKIVFITENVHWL